MKMRTKYTGSLNSFLQLECCKCASIRLLCANCLVVQRSCAPEREHYQPVKVILLIFCLNLLLWKILPLFSKYFKHNRRENVWGSTFTWLFVF